MFGCVVRKWMERSVSFFLTFSAVEQPLITGIHKTVDAQQRSFAQNMPLPLKGLYNKDLKIYRANVEAK